MSLKNHKSIFEKNLLQVNELIAKAAKKSGRSAEEITLLAVAKKVPTERVREAFHSGVRHFAENYLQEATQKQSELNDYDIDWHFIGHVQSNKIKNLVSRFSLIHSVDREKLIVDMASKITSENPQKILLEVNLVGEASKSGCAPGDLPKLIELVQKQKTLLLAGLMFMPPLDLSEQEQRRYYEKAQKLHGQMVKHISQPHSLVELSMGTSHDFEVAIEAGATIIRLGTVLFGERS